MATRAAGTRLSAAPGHLRRAGRASACALWASGGPPPARSVAPACGPRSSPPAAAGGRPAAGPSEHGVGPAPGFAGAASAPRCPPAARAASGCGGSAPPAGRHAAAKPGIDPAEPGRLCGVVPGSEVFLGQLLQHRLVERSIGEQSFQAGVFLFQLLEALGIAGLHRAIELLPAVVRRCPYLQGSADVGDGLALVEELLSGAQLADELFRGVALAFHAASPGQVWPVGKLS